MTMVRGGTSRTHVRHGLAELGDLVVGRQVMDRCADELVELTSLHVVPGAGDLGDRDVDPVRREPLLDRARGEPGMSERDDAAMDGPKVVYHNAGDRPQRSPQVDRLHSD